MKILLTGAGGQVGQAIIKANAHYAHTLVASDHKTCDITSRLSLKTSMALHQPDVVINAAAYTAVDKAETDQENAFRVNAIGLQYLAQACAEADIPLLHLSTDYIFDGHKSAPYVETDGAAPLSVYGKSKWQGEQFIRELHAKHIILRVSWLFGDTGQNFVKTMLHLMQTREELRVVFDQRGCPTHADDIAHRLLTLVDHTQWGTYHFCGEFAISWYHFAEKIREIAEKQCSLKIKYLQPIVSADYPQAAARPQNSVLDCQKFIQTFGLPLSDWQQGLEKVLTTLCVTQQEAKYE